MAGTIPSTIVAPRAACGHCMNWLTACTCTPESLATAEHHEHVMCSCCGLAKPYKGFDECLACAVAYIIHEDPSDIDRLRRQNAGTYWLEVFNREVERQLSAQVAA